MRSIFCALVLVHLPSWGAGFGDLEFELESNLPREIVEYLEDAIDLDSYRLDARLNPFYLQADFDGNGLRDTAILVIEKSTGKAGILIFHAGMGEHYVLGAGTNFGNGGDDFSALDAWRVRTRGPVERGAHNSEEAPVLKGDALWVEKLEAASAIIYWTGNGYGWYQRGD